MGLCEFGASYLDWLLKKCGVFLVLIETMIFRRCKDLKWSVFSCLNKTSSTLDYNMYGKCKVSSEKIIDLTYGRCIHDKQMFVAA